MKHLKRLIKYRGLINGIKLWIKIKLAKCEDCGKGLYRFTDWENAAGANGAIDINVGGHKRVVHLCWLCYHKNK